jgi:biotin synthase
MVYKMIALTRIVCPAANIPSTTALATINKVDGRKLGLKAGANVVMPNLTQTKYRSLYEIYPAKACIEESAADCNQCLRGQIHSLGRFPGQGQGGRGAIETPVRVTTDTFSQFVQLQN